MNNKQFLEFAEKELSDILKILKAKNSDYTADSPDAFANFRVTESLGLSSAETGILIRTVDKIQRVKSFLSKGNLEVPNESAQDAVKDIIGYSIILLGMLKEKEVPNNKIDLVEICNREYNSTSHLRVDIDRKSGAV